MVLRVMVACIEPFGIGRAGEPAAAAARQCAQWHTGAQARLRANHAPRAPTRPDLARVAAAESPRLFRGVSVRASPRARSGNLEVLPGGYRTKAARPWAAKLAIRLARPAAAAPRAMRSCHGPGHSARYEHGRFIYLAPENFCGRNLMAPRAPFAPCALVQAALREKEGGKEEEEGETERAALANLSLPPASWRARPPSLLPGNLALCAQCRPFDRGPGRIRGPQQGPGIMACRRMYLHKCCLATDRPPQPLPAQLCLGCSGDSGLWVSGRKPVRLAAEERHTRCAHTPCTRKEKNLL